MPAWLESILLSPDPLLIALRVLFVFALCGLVVAGIVWRLLPRVLPKLTRSGETRMVEAVNGHVEEAMRRVLASEHVLERLAVVEQRVASVEEQVTAIRDEIRDEARETHRLIEAQAQATRQAIEAQARITVAAISAAVNERRV